MKHILLKTQSIDLSYTKFTIIQTYQIKYDSKNKTVAATPFTNDSLYLCLIRKLSKKAPINGKVWTYQISYTDNLSV